jgi:hypothetical protein
MKIASSSRPILSLAVCALLALGGCHSGTKSQSENAQQATPPTDAGNAVAGGQNSAGAPETTSPPAQAAPPPAQYRANQPPSPQYRQTPSGQGAAAAAAPASYTIPAGTPIRVRVNEALSSQTSQSGQTFGATLASPIVVNGQTVAKTGAAASGTIVTATSRGRFKGAGELDLRLDTIHAEGHDIPVQTSNIERVESGKGKRTAVLAGGGGGLGALIGGIAGGGKGALIGALTGAAAGGAGGAFTGNKQVTVPAETVLDFRLEHDVTVTGRSQ